MNKGKCMCCNAEKVEIYPAQSRLGAITLNYCGFCVQFGAEPYELLKDILGTSDPERDIRILFYDPEVDWYKDYMSGNVHDPARTNEGKLFSSLGSLRSYAEQLQVDLVPR